MWRHGLLPEILQQVLDLVPFRYRVASCSDCVGVAMWGAKGLRRTVQGHTEQVAGLRFFPSGDRLLTWAADGRAIVWDTASEEPLLTLDHPGPVECAAVFPAGDRIVTCVGDGSSTIWRASTGEVLFHFEDHHPPSKPVVLFGRRVRDVEVSASGKRLLTWGREAWASMWDAGTGLKACELHGHSHPIIVAQMVPTSGRVVTGSFDKTAIIWAGSSCQPLHALPHDHWVTKLWLVSDGAAVATLTGSGTVRLWSTQSGEQLRELVRQGDRLSYPAYSIVPFPHGDRLITFNFGAVIVWNTTSGDELLRLNSESNWTHDAAVSPGGDVIVTCTSRQVVVWDIVSFPGTARAIHRFEDLEPRPVHRRSKLCFVALGLGRAADPRGIGRGLSWRELP